MWLSVTLMNTWTVWLWFCINLHDCHFQAMSAAACFMISGKCTPSHPPIKLYFNLFHTCIGRSLLLFIFFSILWSLDLASVELTRDFCEQLDNLVGPQLTLLASDICEQFTINRRISGSVESPTLPFLFALLILLFVASSNDLISCHVVNPFTWC